VLDIARCCATRAHSLDEGDPSLSQARSPLIVFDWDDTLMCSSDIKAHKNPAPEELRMLEGAVQQVLNLALSLGKTCIVTNANMCWVRATASLFMPSIVPMLKVIDVMSARQSYERKWPGDPGAWKKQAFQDLVGVHQVNAAGAGEDVVADERACRGVNLVVLGDSHAEIQAGRSAVHGKDVGVVKTIKFKEVPTTEEMIGQLEAVSAQLQRLVAQDQSASKELVRGSFTSSWSLADTSGASWLGLV